MLRIVTLNANGLRAAHAKGLTDWLRRLRGWDVFCLQELKAAPEDIPPSLHRIKRAQGHFYPAARKGYAGTALWSRHRAEIRCGFGVPEFDAEGRYLEADFGRLIVASVYVPSGSAGPERQASKDRFLAVFPAVVERLVARGKEVLLCGDFNIAHREIDLKNWRSNQKHSGFLPHERAWIGRLFDEFGFVDVFRRLDPRPEQYTWWSNRGQAWSKNVGWRIDYQIATPGLAATARRALIYKDERFSDHAPLVIDYDFALGS
ncbi:MAG: exodeoxyribonuclease III [Casimicrobiaceae bacterium]|nr:exodeoxyribonuclease III [Casimicrobiaceae bacterium]MCX8099352.1 exodeoxyribonuclease III [Casimicrobiaceae bacterium]MDW8311226.1 exodeoxyribonuclease III [Burkholderiales bacterium]